MKKQIFILIISVCWSVENTMTITEPFGITTENYPLQFGRPFVDGEIPNFPQALIDGFPLLTQANVKSRWEDGSVKYAIINCHIPFIEAGSSHLISFQNQVESNTDSSLSTTEMLAENFDFDGTMELVHNGDTITADARTMLENEDYFHWLQGPVSTSIILADHSEERIYDIGFDGHRSFRPIFLATFWPLTNQVKLRFIGEIANSEVLQDKSYALTLFTGSNTPLQQYSKSEFTQHARSRWTKEFWLGDIPPAINIDHNVEYLSATTLIPNYDPGKEISESVIDAAYSSAWNSWLNSERDLFDAGNWTKYMPGTGGRREIGPYPTWTVQWLYTGDWRMKEYACGNADLAAAFPIHFREGDPTKYFDRDMTVPAIGKVISVSDRPTFWSLNLDWNGTTDEDLVTPVGEVSENGWIPDNAHQPDPVSVQYMLTGDYWYLEELYFWASFGASNSNGAYNTSFWGRGPTGAEGGIPGQVRSQAWLMRTRVHTVSLAPDDSPEYNYFKTLTDDAIAIWEGVYNITESEYFGDDNWNWGHDVYAPTRWDNMGPPVMHQWDKGGTYPATQWPMNPEVVSYASAPWQQNFVMFTLGRAEELGHPTEHLRAWLGEHIIGMLTHPDFNPYAISAYREPSVRLIDGEYFATWADLLTGYLPEYDAQSEFQSTTNDTEHGYANISIASAAMVADLPGGNPAWQFMAENALSNSLLDDNPKWAIIPREQGGGIPGDVNSDGEVNIMDIVLTVNIILADEYNILADLNNDEIVDILDIVLMVNIILE